MTVFEKVLCKNESSTLTDVDLTKFLILKESKSKQLRGGIKIIVKSRKERYEKKSDYDLNGSLIFKS